MIFGKKVKFSGPYGSLEVIKRSFGGNLVTQNSNLISAINSASKKPMKRHITCPKVRFGKEVMFSGPHGSLEVIWRSFGDSKLKSDKRNRLGVQKNL